MLFILLSHQRNNFFIFGKVRCIARIMTNSHVKEAFGFDYLVWWGQNIQGGFGLGFFGRKDEIYEKVKVGVKPIRYVGNGGGLRKRID